GEDRKIDEELGQVHETPLRAGSAFRGVQRLTVPDDVCACRSGRALIATRSGATTAPGRTRCRPLTMTCSPGRSPVLTTRRPSANAPSVTARYSALLSRPTTMTNFLSWSV